MRYQIEANGNCYRTDDAEAGLRYVYQLMRDGLQYVRVNGVRRSTALIIADSQLSR